MGRRKLTAGCDPNLSLQCSICGDKPRGNNFTVLSCVSCKSFFQRYGLLKLENVSCKYNGSCIVTKETRSGCRRCRLKKCLESGMDPQMIRGPLSVQTNSLKTQQPMTGNEKQLQLPMPQPINLLRNDCSNLTSDQWNLLSNIIRSYDEENMINRIKDIVVKKCSLPPKLRLKPADTLNLISEGLKNILPLVERSPDFRCLSRNAHRALILHNLYYTGVLNGYFINREIDLFRNPTYMSACSLLHGNEFMMKCAQDNERLVPNGNLYKLMLFVLIFSSNCSIVVFNDKEDIRTIASTIELIRVQNVYATVLWKYLVYLYGFNGAVMHFSAMIKNVVDLLIRLEEASEHRARKILLDRVVTQTERSLSITD